MNVNFWGFLSIGVIFGTSLTMLSMYLSHKKSMKELELEALKLEKQNETAD